MTEDDIYEDFKARGITFDKIEHEPVFTVRESEAIYNKLSGAHTKNLFLRAKSGRFWLVVMHCDKRADLKELAKRLGAEKLSFGSVEEMARVLQTEPGSVSPLAAINSQPGQISVIFDETLSEDGRIAIHPLRNTATISLSFEDLIRWLEVHNLQVQSISFG